VNISKGTGNSPLIQVDLVYARVGGTSLRLDMYAPAGRRPGCRCCSTSTTAAGQLATKPGAAVERLMPIVPSGFAVAA
jgi:hypothetical protein